MLNFRYHVGAALLLSAVLGLTACVTDQEKQTQEFSRYNPAKARVERHHQRQQLMQSLASSGAQIIRSGDEVRVLLPTDGFFEPNSIHFKPVFHQVLRDLAALISSYTKTAVRIISHTDGQCTNERSVVLAQTRVRDVARYLWKQGIDARMLLSHSEGKCQPIASNKRPAGRKHNRRIEVVFYRLSL